MNIINKILGKDVSSIIFKYLTINNKINHLKIIGYINMRLCRFTYINDNNFVPSFIKIDQPGFHSFFNWNCESNIWDYDKIFTKEKFVKN